MDKKILVTAIVAIGVVAAIAGYMSYEGAGLGIGTVQITDMAGRTVSVPSTINNIVVLYGPGYEKLVMLGAEDKIDACADFHKTHAAWAHIIYKKLDTLPALSNPQAPNVESVLNYNPNVVFWFGNDKYAAEMTNAKIPVICSVGNNTSLDSEKTALMTYAQVLGPQAVQRAQKYIDYFNSKESNVTSITSTIHDSAKPKVYVTSGILLRTRGGNSQVRDTVEKAGGVYVSKDAPSGTNVISYEQLLAWNPDIIIIDHAPDLPDPSQSATSNTSTASAIYAQIMNDSKLQNVSAVKNHKVYISPEGAFFWDAGEQGILQLQWMAKLFYPDKFKNINMTNVTEDFYSEFFNYNLTNEQTSMILNHQLPPGAEKWGYK